MALIKSLVSVENMEPIHSKQVRLPSTNVVIHDFCVRATRSTTQRRATETILIKSRTSKPTSGHYLDDACCFYTSTCWRLVFLQLRAFLWLPPFLWNDYHDDQICIFILSQKIIKQIKIIIGIIRIVDRPTQRQAMPTPLRRPYQFGCFGRSISSLNKRRRKLMSHPVCRCHQVMSTFKSMTTV
jgi:hypothetical protein